MEGTDFGLAKWACNVIGTLSFMARCTYYCIGMGSSVVWPGYMLVYQDERDSHFFKWIAIMMKNLLLSTSAKVKFEAITESNQLHCTNIS